jgi:enamine deaminase RidA (YjgF/YER057c/UK114 family)
MTSDRRDVVKAAVAGAAVMTGALLNSKAMAATESGGGLIKLVPYDPPRNYARASVYGKLIFHCGEDSKDPKTQQVRGKNAEEQAGFTFENIQNYQNDASPRCSVSSNRVYVRGRSIHAV